MLQNQIPFMKNIWKLDVADNGFDYDIVGLCSAMQVRELLL